MPTTRMSNLRPGRPRTAPGQTAKQSASGVSEDWSDLAPRASAPAAYSRTTARGCWASEMFFSSTPARLHRKLHAQVPAAVSSRFHVFVPCRSPARYSSQSVSEEERRGFEPPISVNTLAPGYRPPVRQQGISRRRDARARRGRCRRAGSAQPGHSLVRKRNLNQPPPGPGAVDERRPIPGYGDILLVEAAGASLSHALQLRVERPRARGLWLRGAYTWGKSIDDGSAFLASEGNDNTPQWSDRPDLERGLSDYDVRHRGVRRGHLGSAGDGRHGAGARLAGERAAVAAERAALHAAGDQRQQQHRQPGRAVRLRPARRGAAGDARRGDLRRPRVSDRAGLTRSARPGATS